MAIDPAGFDQLLPPVVATSLREAMAQEPSHLRLALVGGAVRDSLLHRVHRDPWRGLPDLDLVVEAIEPGEAGAGPPPAHRLAMALQRLEPQALGFCRFHAAYGTVELELHGVLLDLASARRETYPLPAENPKVTLDGLEADLTRRDFSINAMALLIGDDGGAELRLLDPHGGQQDLAQRQLRFLHDASLRDDPTRLLRAARYAARLGFELAPESRLQAMQTLKAWPWPWRPGDAPAQAPPALGTRLRMELELLLEREPWQGALRALQGWGGLELLDASLQADTGWPRRLRWAQRFGVPLPGALVVLADDSLSLAERLQLPHRQHRLLAQVQELKRRLAGAEGLDPAPSWWCHTLEAPGLSPEAVALALAAGIGPRRPLLRWWLRWRHIQAPFTAAELMQREGLKPGPALGERLRQLRAERIDQLR